MLSGAFRPILGTLGLTQIRYVAPVRRRAATGVVARVYGQVERDFGVLAPPISLHAAAPPLLAAAWAMLRETLIVPGGLPRADKEALAAQVSRENACPYCVTVHESVVRRLGPGGAPDRPVPPGPEAAAMALVMHYLNRMVNVFLRDVPLPPGVPSWALPPVMRLLGTDMLAASRRPHLPGASLDLLSPAAPPDDLTWAAGAPGEALARAAAVIEEGGRRALPARGRAAVDRVLAGWRGGPMGLSRRWTDDHLSGIPDDEKALTRLALLVAFASYQVDAEIVKECRAAGAGDAVLLQVSAWSALVAARRIVAPAAFGAVQERPDRPADATIAES